MCMFRSRLVLWGLLMNSWSSLSANPYRIRYGNSAFASILSTSWGANSLSSSPFRGEMLSPGVLCGLHHKYIPIQVHPTSGKCTKSTPCVSEYSWKGQWGQQPFLDCRKKCTTVAGHFHCGARSGWQVTVPGHTPPPQERWIPWHKHLQKAHPHRPISNIYLRMIVHTLQKQMCYFSKLFGYYNCVTILTMQILCMHWCKRIHVMGADTWINFTCLPQNVLQALDSLN